MNLDLEHIAFKHGSLEFFYNACFSEPITGIFGYSGSGKTTLLHLVCGLEKPLSGRMKFNGRVLFDGHRNIFLPAHRRNFGVVFQGNRLFPHLSVRKNLLYGSQGKNCSISEVTDLLDLGTLMKKKPHQLSGGESQRVAIARCLLSNPELLLMDEPFSNLDRQRRVEIICYLRRVAREMDIPLVIISHDLEDLLKLSENLVIVQDQSIRAAGHFEELAYGHEAHPLLTGT